MGVPPEKHQTHQIGLHHRLIADFGHVRPAIHMRLRHRLLHAASGKSRYRKIMDKTQPAGVSQYHIVRVHGVYVPVAQRSLGALVRLVD